MPETDPEFMEAPQEEHTYPREKESAKVRREREPPCRTADLPETVILRDSLELADGRPLDSMAVRASIIPVEELRMEVLLTLVRAGQDRLRPLSREDPKEHEDGGFRIRGREDESTGRLQDASELLDEVLPMLEVLVHFGCHDGVHRSGSEGETGIRGSGEIVHAVRGLGRLPQGSPFHVDAHREAVGRASGG